MKKYTYCLVFIIMSCTAQNKELKEAKVELEEQIASINSLLSFMDTSFLITPTIEVPNDSLDKFDFRKPFDSKDTTVTKEKIDTYLDAINFYEDIQYPTNYIELSYDNNEVASIIGNYDYFRERKDEEPIYLLKKVTFKDKSTLNTTDTITYDNNSFKKGIQLKSSKPVDKLTVEVQYQYPSIEKISLDKQNTIASFPEGDIILKGLEKNQVTLIMPKTLKERIIDINAIYKDGRVLDSKGMSGRTLPSKEKLLFFEEVLALQEKALKKLKNNEFADKVALETFINSAMPAEPKDQNPLFTGFYYFSGDVSSINLFVKKEQNIFNKKNIIIETSSYQKSKENKMGYYIAKDQYSGKDGLVGIDGKWKVKPDFLNLRIHNRFYYGGTYNGDLNQLYHLNIKQNKLERVSYDIQGIETYYDNLVITSKRSNVGLINGKTGLFILPMKYKFVKETNGVFIVKNEYNMEGVYNKKGKKILPEIYDDVRIYDDKIQTVRYVEGKSDLKEVFNLKGIKLSK